MKLDEKIKCPHCEKEGWYVFYDNAETLECHYCNKPFDIMLDVKVKVTAKMPKRVCCICSTQFLANDSFEHEVSCPECGHKGGHSQCYD